MYVIPSVVVVVAYGYNNVKRGLPNNNIILSILNPLIINIKMWNRQQCNVSVDGRTKMSFRNQRWNGTKFKRKRDGDAHKIEKKNS